MTMKPHYIDFRINAHMGDVNSWRK